MASATVEDYLKAIMRASDRAPQARASTGTIAKLLGLSPGSVTGMLQRLTQARLVDYSPHQGARLTRRGRRRALQILRRHRLLELFLAQTLGLAWDEVHKEAEQLEHSASDDLIDRIDAYLGFPERDPHGDPIPDGDGQFRTSEGEPLAALEVGQRLELLRVSDDSAQLLRYLAEHGFRPGCRAKVASHDQLMGILELEIGARRVQFSHEIARQILVRRV